MDGMEDDDEDDEDEEALQLRLEEIQVRQKIKKLQKKSKQASDNENQNQRPTGGVSRSRSVVSHRALSEAAEARAELLERSKSQTEIHVPVSPIRRAQALPVQRSPARVVLGLDKKLRSDGIPYKQAPNLRTREESSFGPFLQRTASQNDNRILGIGSASQGSFEEKRPRTFNERIAATRTEETERLEREARIKKNRSRTFGIDDNQMKSFKENAVIIPEVRRKTPEFTREQVLSSFESRSSNIPRPRTIRSSQPSMGTMSDESGSSFERSESRPILNMLERKRSTRSLVPLADVTESEPTNFDSYSAQHLSKRNIPHPVLTRELSGKKCFLIPDLLRVVKGPDFNLPDIEEDMVVLGIIASKSEPKAHQPNVASKGVQKGKFMVMTLTDLKWEVDLFIFSSAFDKFWKLTPGTIIAILNPQIMPPQRGKEATGKFSLALHSEADTILEIGSARDLGFCKSVKKDGKICSSWVNKRHTEFCEYHVNEQLKKTRSSRMEVNTMTFGKGNFGGRKTKEAEKKEEQKKTRYDGASHSQIFIGGRTTTSMLDDVDFNPDAFHRGSTKEERMTRRILAQEKERELEKKLGTMGSGIGADYARVRRKAAQSATNPADAPPAPFSAAALGLVRDKSMVSNVSTSPVNKRKRADTSSDSAAVGWGSNLTKELGKMKDGNNRSMASRPPVKKTRFVTAKGIREAGRDSLSGDVVGMALDAKVDDDDDSDDLEIIH